MKLTTEQKIDINCRAMAAHGIHTSEDVTRYCRPPAWACWLFVMFGVLAMLAVSLPLVAAGFVPMSWLLLAIMITTPIAAGVVFGLRACL